MVLRRLGNRQQRLALDEMLRLFEVLVEPVTEEQAWRAIAAYERFGEGTAMPPG